MSNDTTKVQFTRQQYEYLNKMYPERILPASASEAELRFYMGQRSLVLFIQDRVQKGN